VASSSTFLFGCVPPRKLFAMFVMVCMVRGGQGGGADGDWLIRDDRRASEREAVRLREKMHPASLRADAECVEAP